MTSSWFFLSTLNYDARSTTHQTQLVSLGPSIFGLSPSVWLLSVMATPTYSIIFYSKTICIFAQFFGNRTRHKSRAWCATVLVPDRSQWPRGLRCRSAVGRLLRSWVRIPPGSWMCVCFECCVLSGRGLCDELITHPEESY